MYVFTYYILILSKPIFGASPWQRHFWVVCEGLRQLVGWVWSAPSMNKNIALV
jgi:hypothetical protein